VFFFNAEVRRCEFNACTLILDRRPEAARELIDSLGDGPAFSYMVTPTEVVQRLASEDSMRMGLQAALHTAATGGGVDFGAALQSLNQFEGRAEMRIRNPLVVGYGIGSSQDQPTTFGWVIRPHLMSHQEGGDTGYLQIARQYPLSAVVSVPSWWRSLKVTVRSSWIEELDLASVESEHFNGKCKDEGPQKSCREHFVRLPGSVKEINEKLRYEVRKEPYVDEMATNARGSQFLEIGRPGQIILEGGRLWRGTVVTMGHQQATRIVVLPDMNGIIAEFACVEPPPGVGAVGEPSKEDRWRWSPRVTVWTSEGRTSTPFAVHLMPFRKRPTEGANVAATVPAQKDDTPCFLRSDATTP
jgi:hypothetical protein